MLITAGPTHEPIDAVRYLANRSSGKLGLAITAAARDAGWSVTLLLGPVPRDTPLPAGVATHRYGSTADLEALLAAHFDACDALVMAAAVADYRPVGAIDGKLERGAGMTLTLEPTPDLVAGCAKRARADQFIVAFSLEPADQLAERAPRKLARKGVSAIVANPLQTIDADAIDATLFTAAGGSTRPGAMPKPDFARWLVRWIEEATAAAQRHRGGQ
jgi:phosphopantothenoylcysteine decarboxylase/phosphopantothenate--cysteine ligase